MALNLSNKYPGRANPPSVDYPEGSIKNQTAPGAKDGTPLDADWANDKEGFFQSLLHDAGETANGDVDKVGASQYFDALKTVISQEVPFATQSEFDAHDSNDKAVSPLVMKPVINGNATLTGSNNVISMASIVSSLGLEKGDVIKVVAGSYDKLHTVESITDSNSIVVNYEHCGSRGNGALKLPDYTGLVTIKRIAKWHSASEGLGQAWVVLTSLRSTTREMTNSTNRSIAVSISGYRTGAPMADISVGGHVLAVIGYNTSPITTSAYLTVGDGESLDVSSALTNLTWSERR